MKLALQLRKSVLLISAGLMLTGCASNETAGELVETTIPISEETQEGELDRDAELLGALGGPASARSVPLYVRRQREGLVGRKIGGTARARER